MDSPVSPPDQAAAAQVTEHDDFLEGFISEEAYAARRGVSLRTCQRDRQLRQAPPFVVFGRQVLYRTEAVRDWLISREKLADRTPKACVSGGRSDHPLQDVPRSGLQTHHPDDLKCPAPPLHGGTMSVPAISWAQKYAAGSATEKVLLLVLANYADEFGVSWPSQKTLAKQTALGERTVRRVLADMERRGVIRRIVRRRDNGSRQSDKILLSAFESRKPAPPGMLDDGPKGARYDHSDQPAKGNIRPSRPLDNRLQDPDPPATVAALDTSKILKTTTTATAAGEMPTRVAPDLGYEQEPAASGDADFACLAACGQGLSTASRIAIATTRPVIADWLASGYDLEADILPTLAERTQVKRANPIRTWAFFTAAIAKRHAQRLARTAKAKSAGERGTVAVASTPSNPKDAVLQMAEWINSGRYLAPSAVNNSMRDELLRGGLVTVEKLRAYQIY